MSSASELFGLSSVHSESYIREVKGITNKDNLIKQHLNFPQRSPKEIKLLSYNLFLRPPFIKNNENDHKDERLGEFVKTMTEFDIICLQEVFGLLNNRKSRLLKAARESGFQFHTHAPEPGFLSSNLVDAGLVILSRYPIVYSEFQPYPYGVFSDALSQKGILYAQIKVKQTILHLFSTHTQASYNGETQRYSVMTRGDQFKTLRSFIEDTLMRHYNMGDTVLLAGDFNVDARDPTIRTDRVMKHHSFKKFSHLGLKEYFNEYEAMLTMLTEGHEDEIQDLLLESYGHHPVTYAEASNDGRGIPMETVLTAKEDLCSNQSLDFIFNLTPKSIMKKKGFDISNHLAEQRLSIVEESGEVKKFFIDDQEFTQLSDHYGVSVTLEYQEKDEVPVMNHLTVGARFYSVLRRKSDLCIPSEARNHVIQHKVPQKFVDCE